MAEETAEISLAEEDLLAQARRTTGLDDFGATHFRDGLRRLLGSLEAEARLNAVGRRIAHAEISRHLENRLRVTRDWKLYPEIGRERVVRPLLVVGLPRTGSTLLHDLLAQDPANRAPLTWECQHPSPPPERATYETDPRIARSEAHFERTSRALIPEFKAIHPMGAKLAQECVMLQAFDFTSIIFHHEFRVPSYQTWVESCDLGPVYGTHRRQLQYLQWRCPGRWVLKSVGHLWGLEELFATYPDALVVQTHRDPRKFVASHASLVTMARRMGSDQVDPQEIGREWSGSWERALRKGIAFRDAGTVDASRFFDLHYQDLVRDPIAAVRRIYDHFGLPFDAEAEQRMRVFLAANPQGKHGGHRYEVEQFGLDAGRLREQFRFYEERFAVASEPAS